MAILAMQLDNLCDRQNSEAARASPEAIEISSPRRCPPVPAVFDHDFTSKNTSHRVQRQSTHLPSYSLHISILIDTNYVDNNSDVNMIYVKNFARV
jgi:hypothetical protein